jgi:hypothetical protein
MMVNVKIYELWFFEVNLTQIKYLVNSEVTLYKLELIFQTFARISLFISDNLQNAMQCA